jgi:hypothetical protein
MMFLEAVGVRIHNLGISIFTLVVCSRLAALRNPLLTSNDFNRQSQISSYGSTAVDPCTENSQSKI